MTLFLVQHGEAEPETEDPERSLTDQGTETVEKLAAWAARIGIKPDEIRQSGKRRAEQTATIFAKRLNATRGVLAVSGLNPHDDVKSAAESVQDDQEPILLVGHLPHLSKLVGFLVAGNTETEIIRFLNGGNVCLTRKEGKWANDWVLQRELLGKLE
jgi:phosphohistidine phosphatase